MRTGDVLPTVRVDLPKDLYWRKMPSKRKHYRLISCYRIRTKVFKSMTCHLGEVKETNDGCFQWTRFPQRHNALTRQTIHEQGTQNTLQDAMALVEEVLNQQPDQVDEVS